MPKEFFIEQPSQKEVRSKLEELEKYPDLKPRLTVAWPITKEKEELLEMVNAEEVTDKKDMKKVKELQKNDDLFVREIGYYLSDKNKFTKHDKKTKLFQKLLSTRKPLFATPHIPELAKKISTIEKASTVLQEKYKDRFIGIIVFGSTHKGYSEPGSDIDYMLSGLKKKDKKLLKKFENLTRDIKFCSAYSNYLGAEKFKKTEDIGNLFHGIFFGNHRKLLELQKQTLEKMDKNKWNIIRKDIKNEETKLSKAAERFDIKNEELLEQIRANVAILRTPPPLEEAREIINKRYEQEIKKKE